MLVVASPVIYVLSSPEANNLNIAAVMGAVFWSVGFIFETGGDWQLQRFKKNPANKGQLLKNGLCSITRVFVKDHRRTYGPGDDGNGLR